MQKSISLVLFGLMMSALAYAQNASSVGARQDAQSFNAPQFLQDQTAETCAMRRLIEKFKVEQHLESVQGVKANANGKEEVNSITGSRFDTQEIQSGNTGYKIIFRLMDSGLSGETLTVLAAKDSCQPSKAYVFNGNEFVQVRLVGGLCFEPAKRAPRVRRGEPAASPTPPPPRTLTEKFCTILKGEDL